jgi:Uma2 family endonuclease
VVAVTANLLPPAHLLTVAEYAALGEDEHGRTELMEGNLVMSPSPSFADNLALQALLMQLHAQLPDELLVSHDLDVDLQLVPPDQPGTSRRPDVLIFERAAKQRVRAEGGVLRASEVLLAVEVVSPGSRRIDNIVKRAEYQDAGIPHYWIVDIEAPVSLVACRRTASGYRDEPAVAGTYEADEPFPLRIDLDALL